MPFWWVRTFSGIMILTGEICFVVNVYTTWRESKTRVEGNVEGVLAT